MMGTKRGTLVHLYMDLATSSTPYLLRPKGRTQPLKTLDLKPNSQTP